MNQPNGEGLPKHIAIIMDGNGRWAKGRGQARIFGHKNGVRAVRAVTEACAELGVEYLTLYAFSTENWNRPRLEVSALMNLLVQTVNKEIKTLNKNKIRLHAIGEIEKLPKRTYQSLLGGIEETAVHEHMNLILALNYSGRWDIANAAKKMALEVQAGNLDPEKIDQDEMKKYLSTAPFPDPDLLIRTSGEQRLSNFLLWETAYTELYFTDIFWPDFNKEHLKEAIWEYQNRERRYGKTGEQLANQ